MPEGTSFLSLLINACSLLISGLAAALAWWAHKQALQVQKRLLKIEEEREQERKLSASKARLTAELRKKENYWAVYIINSGDAEARNVEVMLNGKPAAEHPGTFRGVPIPTLIGPEASISFPLIWGLNTEWGPPFEIEIRWDDDAGTGHTYRTVLTP